MDLDGIGYARHLQEQRARILANVPASHRARILGRPAPYAEAKRHAISVDCRTGERTVVQLTPIAAPKPKPAQPPRPVVAKPAPVEKHSPEAIIDVVLEVTGLSRYEFLREGRCRDIVTRARQLAYWIVCRLHPSPKMSWPAKGLVFRKHHSTVMSGYWRFEQTRVELPTSEWLQHPKLAEIVDAADKSGALPPLSSLKRSIRENQRAFKGRRKGENHPEAKMTAEQVIAIRADQRNTAQIAAAYGMSRSGIKDIRSRKTWRHI